MLPPGICRAIKATRQHSNFTCQRRIVRCAEIILNWSHDRRSTHSVPPLVQGWQRLEDFANTHAESGKHCKYPCKENNNRASGTPPELQGRLLSILAHYPTTADSAQSCLLCYQPEPVPRTLAARTSQFTLGYPCRLSAWSGWAIHMHPQHIQSSRVLHLPHVTAMTGQVKVSKIMLC